MPAPQACAAGAGPAAGDVRRALAAMLGAAAGRGGAVVGLVPWAVAGLVVAALVLVLMR